MAKCLYKTAFKLTIRKSLLLTTDIILINAATLLALFFRFDGTIPKKYIDMYLGFAIYATLIKVSIYYFFNLYKSLWKYAGIEELLQVFFATLIGSIFSYVLILILYPNFPRSISIITWLLTFTFIGSSRLSYRIMRRIKNIDNSYFTEKRRVMIIGAGFTGSTIIKELKKHPRLNGVPVVVIDDDIKKHGLLINGIPVKGDRTQILELAEQYKIDEIIIAIPSVKENELKKILEICKHARCQLKIVPTFGELINGQVGIKQIRDVHIEDLLGREPVKLHTEEISGYLEDKVVMVTGGGGSIGSELCRQIMKFHPKKLIIFEIYENNAYELENELRYTYKKNIDLEILIGSIQDKHRLKDVFSTYKPEVIFHAAAHKHVPLMEQNPTEAIKNNVFGTLNVASFASEYKAERFVLISTDKAVNPTNIMGATKRIAEMIIQNISRHSTTKYAAVRFGNVLGSNGSVIPLFQNQIALGGPITITHPEVTRFFMTIPEAAQLVIQAGSMANGGEIFILDMGKSVKVMDLAKDLIRLSGLEPEVDIAIECTGLRPGEKLYEELLMKEEGKTSTKHNKIFKSNPIAMDYKTLMKEIAELTEILSCTKEEICAYVEKIVPTYEHQ